MRSELKINCWIIFFLDDSMLNKFFLFVLISGLAFSSSLFAFDRRTGDDLRIIIPLTAGLGSLLAKDVRGVSELGMGLLVATASTESLKYLTHETRPNGECCASFPSGHTSIAFTSAAYMHFRYGLAYSIPFYMAASYVGYSRVQANSHYTHDVIAGGALGILSAYLTTTAFKDRPIALVLDSKYAGIVYRKVFDRVK